MMHIYLKYRSYVDLYVTNVSMPSLQCAGGLQFLPVPDM